MPMSPRRPRWVPRSRLPKLRRCVTPTGWISRYLVQYMKWLNLIVHGQFGESFEYSRPVTEVIGDRLWLTILLSFAAIIVTWVLALPIGIYSAVRQYSTGDYVFTFIGFIGLAVPSFLLALIVMYFGLRLVQRQSRRIVFRRIPARAVVVGKAAWT